MSVQRIVGLLGWVCAAGAAPVAARAQIWLPAACDIKPGHQLVNSGMQSLRSAFTTKFADQKAKDLKDAERVLTQAVTTGKQEKNPAAWYYLGRYYLMAEDLAAAASDPKYAKDRRDAFFNVARVYHSAKRYDEAIGAYREYLAAYPGDVQGMASLAGLYLLAGSRDSAMALYGRVLERADSASADELFGAAQSILSAIPVSPDTAAMDADCGKAAKKKTPTLTARQVGVRCAPAATDTMRKYHALTDPQYSLVSKTYAAGLAKNPYSRDALYNLAGVSYLIGDSASVLPLAQRLYAVDPMNRSTLAKLAGGWQLKGRKDSVLYYLQVADSLPVEITVSSFTPAEKGATLEGQMTNFRPKPSLALSITFDFLDGKGNVVATQSQSVPALEPSASQEFKLKVDQPGVVAWRYKRG